MPTKLLSLARAFLSPIVVNFSTICAPRFIPLKSDRSAKFNDLGHSSGVLRLVTSLTSGSTVISCNDRHIGEYTLKNVPAFVLANHGSKTKNPLKLFASRLIDLIPAFTILSLEIAIGSYALDQ